MSIDKIQIGWEIVTTVVVSAVGGLTLLWGAVATNRADIENMSASIERIDENVAYLVRRELEGKDPDE